MATFADLGIKEVFIKALNENNIHAPTEIQVKTIPYLLQEGKDLVAQAQTGTGKTAAFGLPILQKIDPELNKVQALVLSPTRELGQQIAKQLFRFARYSPKRIFTEAVYGGAYIGDQIKALSRPTHIVVATPGRLIDLLEKKAIELSHVKTLVLDEADEMLSMGFKKELDHILAQTQGQRNTWLFSATIPPEIKTIINTYMDKDAHRIQIDKSSVVNKDIEHAYLVCKEKEKFKMLLQFLNRQGEKRGVIFCKTKAGAQRLSDDLKRESFSADSIHGDLDQRERDKVMRAFKKERVQLLVATDLAARGIDVEGLSFVIHYDLPEQLDYYTHRSGRTARAGKKGLSLSLIYQNEQKELQRIEGELGIKIKAFSS